MMMVMPPISAIRLTFVWPILKPSKNTGYSRATEVDAGHDHGGGVEQRRDRRRAGHGVGQPGVQRELAGLADGGDEQRDAAHSRIVLLASPDSAQPEMAKIEKPSLPRCSLAHALAPKNMIDDADEEPDVARPAR